MRRRFSIKVHPAGWMIFAGALLFVESHLVLATVAALALHEAAHLLVMYLCGMRECTVELTPFGGMADTRCFDSYQPWKRMVSAAAGVAASTLAAIVCAGYAPRTVFWQAFFQANTSLAFLNAIPAWPLDGARVVAALAACAGAERNVRQMLSWMTILVGNALVLLGLYGVWHGIINPTLLVTGPYLCYAARAEAVSDRVRRLDGINQRFQTDAIVPVALWAGRTSDAARLFGRLLGRGDNGRLQVLMEIDPVSGSIQKCWTEKEMLDELLKMETIDASESIDKGQRL